jgi:hypothetical protein
MSAPGNSQRKWPSNDETHNKQPITAASGIIVRYVSWKKKSGIVVMFAFFSSNVTANDGSFWCLMTEIQKLRIPSKLPSKFFEASLEKLRSFLRSSSKHPSKIFVFFKKKIENFIQIIGKICYFFQRCEISRILMTVLGHYSHYAHDLFLSRWRHSLWVCLDAAAHIDNLCVIYHFQLTWSVYLTTLYTILSKKLIEILGKWMH